MFEDPTNPFGRGEGLASTFVWRHGDTNNDDHDGENVEDDDDDDEDGDEVVVGEEGEDLKT